MLEEVFMAKRTAEFKLQAVLLVRERLAAGVTLQRVSEELDVGPDMLRVWGKQVDSAPENATAEQIFPGHGKPRQYDPMPRGAGPPRPESADEEIARLRRENQRLRLERDFLKKAAAFFAKESQ
jgi:transposase-like protein